MKYKLNAEIIIICVPPSNPLKNYALMSSGNRLREGETVSCSWFALPVSDTAFVRMEPGAHTILSGSPKWVAGAYTLERALG